MVYFSQCEAHPYSGWYGYGNGRYGGVIGGGYYGGGYLRNTYRNNYGNGGRGSYSMNGYLPGSSKSRCHASSLTHSLAQKCIYSIILIGVATILLHLLVTGIQGWRNVLTLVLTNKVENPHNGPSHSELNQGSTTK